MLIVKGFRVSFVLASGKTVRPPSSYALMNDEDGRDWPRCSGLVGPMRSGKTPISHSKAKAYFGYEPLAGSAVIPSGDERSLRNWKLLGDVKEVLYTRRRAGGAPMQHEDDYYHPISKGIIGRLLEMILQLPAGARLYRWGRWYRIELAAGCVWNWRGIVRP
jgi:hypothetical protein